MSGDEAGRMDPPAWPVLDALVADDFARAVLSSPAGSQTVIGRGSADDLRLDVIAAAATIARTYGRPLLVTVVDPDGASTLIVTPEAEVTSQGDHTPTRPGKAADVPPSRRLHRRPDRGPRVREAKPRRTTRPTVTATQVEAGQPAEPTALLSPLGPYEPPPRTESGRGRLLLGVAVLTTVAALAAGAVIVPADEPSATAGSPSGGSSPRSTDRSESEPTTTAPPTPAPRPTPSVRPPSEPRPDSLRPPDAPVVPGYSTRWVWQHTQPGVRSVVVDDGLVIVRRADDAQLRRASDGRLLRTVAAEADDDLAVTADSPTPAVYAVPANGPATRIRARPNAEPTRIRPPRRRADLELVDGSLIAETDTQTWLWDSGAWTGLGVGRGAFVGTLGARAVVQETDGPATISPSRPNRTRPLRVKAPAGATGRPRAVAVSGTTLLLSWSARTRAAGRVLAVVEDRDVLAVVRDAPPPRRGQFVVDPTHTLAYVGSTALRLTGRARTVSATAWRTVTATPGRLFAARTTAPGSRSGLTWDGDRVARAVAAADVAGTTDRGAILATTTRGKTRYGLLPQ